VLTAVGSAGFRPVVAYSTPDAVVVEVNAVVDDDSEDTTDEVLVWKVELALVDDEVLLRVDDEDVNWVELLELVELELTLLDVEDVVKVELLLLRIEEVDDDSLELLLLRVEVDDVTELDDEIVDEMVDETVGLGVDDEDDGVEPLDEEPAGPPIAYNTLLSVV
jgi:hypothetical protein